MTLHPVKRPPIHAITIFHFANIEIYIYPGFQELIYRGTTAGAGRRKTMKADGESSITFFENNDRTAVVTLAN